jgi:hypothetical protein
LYSAKIVTLAKNGFCGTLHEAGTDVSMLLGLIFLLLVGGGAWSLDANSLQNASASSHTEKHSAGNRMILKCLRRFGPWLKERPTPTVPWTVAPTNPQAVQLVCNRLNIKDGNAFGLPDL